MLMPGPLWVCLALMWVGSCHAHSLFTCEPIRVHRCLETSYNMTFFPNMMGHYDQDIAYNRMQPFMPLINLKCSPDVHHFLCQVFIPACTEENKVIHPCREQCNAVRSDCEKNIHTFDVPWPPEMCEKLDPCSVPGSPAPLTTPAISSSAKRELGFWCPLQLKTKPGHGSSFLGAQDCAPPCSNMYFKPHDIEFAKSFIGVCSIICLGATLFTFLTFLIDVKRFRYPERPIIFYAVCYSFVSLIYFIGFLLGNNAACIKAAHPAGVDTVVLGSQSKGCTLLFMLLYFFSIAGIVWWVILTITWFLAAGPKWSCEAIEKKAVWFHSAAWGIPGALTVMLLALNKVEGDNISGVCFVGLYDLDALRYFVLAPLCVGVIVGLFLILAGIVSLNHVRQVIQHDERNQEKLKKFMIRIGVFSCLYLVPLVTLLACYTYEQSHRSSWENTWINDRCQEYSIPCLNQVTTDHERPDLSLFLVKYLMTLVVGISAVFWVSSKKTCSEWAYFFNRTRNKDPISESRRVLQESCEFFLKHNNRVQHKKKHYKPSSHKLKVISKSMGTSTGVTPTSVSTTSNQGTSALGNHEPHMQGSLSETSAREHLDRGTSSRSSRRGERDRERERDGGERRSKTGSSSKVSSRSESLHRVADGRATPRSELSEVRHIPCEKQQLSALNPAHTSSLQDASHQMVLQVPEERKDPKDSSC
ncbi:frizzled-6 isoform X1 [Maylandia zebra]|uniref:Frizzled-6 n=1 Tax=Astatotilapia calliptera TaxID=8154 RepID=A0A3P8R5L4_ASTCA|nr:frizzled-6 isoform X1 [Maylandia zebra]XP_004541675.1 frizzled-6 isoform X1 [Maylandia zebra]XP_026040022.1 frizzled-6 isoform X1 [Astatotilapia calliptera]XP_026040023.1 frizzled-6 isoform X1 [Astatotilapia calliptera]